MAGLAITAAGWVIAGRLVVPELIREAHAGETFLAALLSGREMFPLGHYLEAWDTFFWTGLAGIVAAWIGAWVLAQQRTRAVLRFLYARVPPLKGAPRLVTILLAVAALQLVWKQATQIPRSWESARGWEYELIATSIVAGRGFSFPPGNRWLFPSWQSPEEAMQYGPTAWKEPVYPYFMALALGLLGERTGRLAIVLCQSLFLAVTLVLVYLLGARLFGPLPGALASVIVASQTELHRMASGTLQTSTVAGCLLLAGLYLLLWYEGWPTPRRAAVLGLALAAASLTHAVSLVLLPLTLAYVALKVHRSVSVSFRRAVVVVASTAVVLTPWAVRNALQFRQFIPIQTGFGFFANTANPYLVSTYNVAVDPCARDWPPPFRTGGPGDAVRAFRDSTGFQQLSRYAQHCVAASAGDRFSLLNEAERDGLHRAEFVSFVRHHPQAFVELSLHKTWVYLFSGPLLHRKINVLAFLAVLGALLVLRRPRAWILPVTVLLFTIPYVLTAPLYERYRTPLEPIMALLASAGLAQIVQFLCSRWPSASRFAGGIVGPRRMAKTW